MSGLVIGSLSPDFEYFLYMPGALRIGHTLLGVFLFCLPAGLAAFYIFHNVMKGPLLTLLPRGLQARLPSAAHRPVPVILASILVGASTHLVWDAFTHPAGWVVLHVPFLAQTAIHLLGRPIPAYTLLQHGSTAVGVVILLCAFRAWYRRAQVKLVPSTRRPPAWLLAGLIIVPAGVASASAAFHIRSTVRLFVGRSVVAYVAFLALELLAFSIVSRRSFLQSP